jgi:flagellar export protein FliJ
MADGRRFRLDQVLRLEQQQEEIKQRELSTLAHQRRVAHEALQTLLKQAQELRDSLSGRLAGPVDAAELAATGAYLDAIAESIRSHEDVMRRLEEQVLGSRDELVEILKRRRMLEELRDRHAAEQAADAARREQRAADDLTSTRASRQAKEAR